MGAVESYTLTLTQKCGSEKQLSIDEMSYTFTAHERITKIRKAADQIIVDNLNKQLKPLLPPDAAATSLPLRVINMSKTWFSVRKCSVVHTHTYKVVNQSKLSNPVELFSRSLSF